jgi:hypothetical protein
MEDHRINDSAQGDVIRRGPARCAKVASAVALIAAIFALPSAAARQLTPDQQLVAGLETARTASRAALKDLGLPSAKRVESARHSLDRALAALAAANTAAPRAVGALETPSVRVALRQARTLVWRAAKDTANRRYKAARGKIGAALDLKTVALADFGVPLEKEFAAFAVDRDFRNIAGFAGYSGLSATAGDETREVVIGAADRTTANAGEPSGTAVESSGLPITAMTVYIVSDPIGDFRSGWCTLADGLIACHVSPAMNPEDIFTIAFGPKLPKGTKLLVKFRSTTGKRSFAVFATR